jgi:NRAMP (natural resistance-associated macrophage protein)-like metal ion transporter
MPNSIRSSNPVKEFLARLGPGLITGASDDDPSGIGSFTQAGAAFGYATLWTAFFLLPLMIVVQHISAKIGMVSGRGLASVLKHYYCRWILFPAVACLVIANTINAGTDILAIAAAINLLIPIPILALVVPIAVAIVVLQVWGSYQLIVKVFKWLVLALFAYVIAAFLARPNWSFVVKATFLPPISLTSDYLMTIVALLGTSISPYLFFWQASEEVEEERCVVGRRLLSQRKGATNKELSDEKIDTITGMALSQVVMYFVILAAASTLHVAGKTNIQSATEAAQALTPLAGKLASVLFSVGLIGAGLLGVPVLTGSAAYAVAETFNWKEGLDEKPRAAKKFYVVIAASTLVGIAVAFAGVDPITALFYTAVINGVVAPPLLVVIMLIANNKKVMGKRTNGVFANVVGCFATALMFAAAIAMFVTWGQ